MKPPALALTSRFWAAAYAAWFLVLTAVSHISSLPFQPKVVGWDKVEHFSYFAAGAVALGLALGIRQPAPRWTVIRLAVIITGTAVGCFDEWHQSFVPGRSGNDPWDLGADFLGSCCGAWLLPMVWRRLRGAAQGPAERSRTSPD